MEIQGDTTEVQRHITFAYGTPLSLCISECHMSSVDDTQQPVVLSRSYVKD